MVLAGREETDDTEEGVGVGTVRLTPEGGDGVSEETGDDGEGVGVGVNVSEADGGRVTDGVEMSESGVARDTSFDPRVVGLRMEVSKEVSRGSGIATD